jgi:signal transduction histidine kinase
MVVSFQAAVIGLLALRGFPAERLVVHAAICFFYLVVCRYPAGGTIERNKVRVLVGGLLSYAAWIGNTGALASPLIPLGVGILSPAALVLRTWRQRGLFLGGALGLLFGLCLLSSTPWGALLPPLAPHRGEASLEYLLIAASSIIVTGGLLSSFWSRMTADYDRVAVELGTRREELCSESEDRTRELEEAAARLAHELKNPLASIKCLSAHMARGSADARTAERLAVVVSEADRLQAIIESFTSLSRGLGELSLAPIRPHQISRELVLLLDIRAKEAGVALEVTGDADLELVADAKKIHRVLFYLVVNAIQASARGQTVTIEVAALPPDGDRALIKVIDRGEGMTGDVLQRLKRPYFSTRDGGTGLGVAVARALIEQHGGHIEHESAPGRGTTATIELPRHAPPAGSGQKLLPDALRTHALSAMMAGSGNRR